MTTHCGDIELRADAAALSQTWLWRASAAVSAGPVVVWEVGGGLLEVPPALAVGDGGGGGSGDVLKAGEGTAAVAGAEAGPAEAPPAANGDVGRVSFGREPVHGRDGPPRNMPAWESLERSGSLNKFILSLLRT